MMTTNNNEEETCPTCMMSYEECKSCECPNNCKCLLLCERENDGHCPSHKYTYTEMMCDVEEGVEQDPEEERYTIEEWAEKIRENSWLNGRVKETQKLKYKECCICLEEYTGYGNNARPLCDGMCCDDCNGEVIKHRFLAIKAQEKGREYYDDWLKRLKKL